MKFLLENKPRSQVFLTFEIFPQEFAQEKEQTILEAGKNVEIEGFRRGKAPREMIEKKLGQAKILDLTVQSIIQDSYKKVVQEKKIEIIGTPEAEILELKQNSSFKFRIKADVMPEVNLPDYKKIASGVKRNEVVVAETEINDSLNWLKTSRAKFTLKNGSCQNGDWVEIKIKLGLKPEIKDAFILGKGKLLAGIEDKVLGMEAGQEKEFSVKIPENFHSEELAGKEIDCKIKLESVQNVELPEITDEFARGLGKFKGIQDFKRSVEEGVLTEKQQQESQRVRQEIVEKISKEVKIEIPDVLIKREQERALEDLQIKVSSDFGMKFEDYLKKINKNKEEISSSLLPKVREQVKKFLILKEIQEQEGISVSEEETLKEANRIISRFPDRETAEKSVDQGRLREYTKEMLLLEKTFLKIESYSQSNH